MYVDFIIFFLNTVDIILMYLVDFEWTLLLKIERKIDG